MMYIHIKNYHVNILTYIIGTEIACAEGYTSENGFTPNCEIAGKMHK